MNTPPYNEKFGLYCAKIFFGKGILDKVLKKGRKSQKEFASNFCKMKKK